MKLCRAQRQSQSFLGRNKAISVVGLFFFFSDPKRFHCFSQKLKKRARMYMNKTRIPTKTEKGYKVGCFFYSIFMSLLFLVFMKASLKKEKNNY